MTAEEPSHPGGWEPHVRRAIPRGEIEVGRVGDVTVTSDRPTFIHEETRVRLELDFAPIDGRVSLRRLELIAPADDDGRGVTAEDLRRVPISALWRRSAPITATSSGGEPPAAEKVRAVRGGRRRMTDEHLQRVAEVYEAHIGNAPIQAVRHAFLTGEGEPVSEATAHRWKSEALKRGLLTRTER